MKKPRTKSQSFRVTLDIQHRIILLQTKNVDWLKSESKTVVSALKKALDLVEVLEKHELLEEAGLPLGSEKIIDEETPRPQKVTIRIPVALLDRVKTLAIKRGAEINHTSQEINLSPTILYLLELGLSILEFQPSNVAEGWMLNPHNYDTSIANTLGLKDFHQEKLLFAKRLVMQILANRFC